MAKFTQIELFLPEQYALDIHRIRIVNPQFKLLGDTEGNWQARSNEWSYTGATGFADYNDAGYHQPLFQLFQNPMRNGMWYNVNFTVSGMTQGILDVYIGTSDKIGSITGNGTYSLPYLAMSGSSDPDRLLFQPSNGDTLFGPWFDGAIKGPISISQDTSLSPPETRTKFEPYGMLDMEGEVRIGMTYRVSDLKQISKRFGAYTKSFRLPGTTNNKKLLSHLQWYTSTPMEGQFDPRYRTKAVLWVDDVPRIYGYLRLKEIVNRGEETWFEVEFYNGQFGLLDEVKGQKLSDLNWDSVSHLLNATNIVNTWSSGWTWQNGYHYPIYLNLEDRFRVRDDFRPAFFNRWILDRIMRDANYSYTITADLEEQFNKLLTAPVGKRPEVDGAFFDGERVLVKSNAGQAWQTSPEYQISFYDQLEQVIVNEQWQLNTEVVDASENFYPTSSLWFFVAPFEGTYTFNLTADTTMEVTTNLTNAILAVEFQNTPQFFAGFEMYDFDTGAVVGSTPSGYWSPPANFSDPTTTYTENVIFSGSFNIDLLAGQRVAVRGVIENQFIYRQFVNGFNIYARPGVRMEMNDDTSFLEIVPTGAYQITEGMLVDPRNWLNDITQEQFIADHIKLFNAYFIPDVMNERRVHITSYSELYDSDLVLDLSNKVALDDDVITEPMANISSSEVQLGYKKPIQKDEYNGMYTRITNEQYGDHLFDNETDYYTNRNESRLSIYTPCPIVRDNNGRYVAGVLSRSQERDVKLLIRSDETLPTQLKLSRYVENSASYTTNVYDYYRPCLHIDAVTASAQTFDVNFGDVEQAMTNVDIDITSNNRFRENYQEQLITYRDGKQITCMMNLTQNDVDFMTRNIGARIFVQELGGWFIWNAIIDFDPTVAEESLTKVELLQARSSNRRIRTRRINRVQAGIDFPSPTGLIDGFDEITGTKVSVFNSNVGYNQLRTTGQYNTVVGSGNTLYQNTSYNNIYGINNRVGAGVSGVTILGGSNIVANDSDSVFLSNYGVVSSTGMTMFSSFTTTNTYTNFYGPSGVVITEIGTSFYGPSGVTITSSGITIGGVEITSAFTQTYVQPGVNISTGGTPSRPVVNVIGSPVFTSVTTTTLTASTIYSGSTELGSLLRYDHPHIMITTATTLNSTHCIVCVDARMGPFTVTLPKLTDVPNWYYIIKDVNCVAATNNITVAAQGVYSIIDTSGVTSVVINRNGGCLTLFATPNEWIVTAKI